MIGSLGCFFLLIKITISIDVIFWLRNIEHPQLIPPTHVEVRFFFHTQSNEQPQEKNLILFANFEANDVSLYMRKSNLRKLSVEQIKTAKFVTVVLKFEQIQSQPHTQDFALGTFDCHGSLDINTPHVKLRGVFCCRAVLNDACPNDGDGLHSCPVSICLDPRTIIFTQILIVVVSDKEITKEVDIFISEKCRTVAQLSISAASEGVPSRFVMPIRSFPTYKVLIGTGSWDITPQDNQKRELSVDVTGVKLKVTYSRINIPQKPTGPKVFKVSVLVVPKVTNLHTLNYFHLCFNTKLQDLRCDAGFLTSNVISSGDEFSHVEEFSLPQAINSMDLHVFKSIIDDGDVFKESQFENVGEMSIISTTETMGSEYYIDGKVNEVTAITFDPSVRRKCDISLEFTLKIPENQSAYIIVKFSDNDSISTQVYRLSMSQTTSRTVNNYRGHTFYTSVQINSVSATKQFLASNQKSFDVSTGQSNDDNPSPGPVITVEYNPTCCVIGQDGCPDITDEQKQPEQVKEKIKDTVDPADADSNKQTPIWVWVVVVVVISFVVAMNIGAIFWFLKKRE